MDQIVECVPNFSEGKDPKVIEAISAAIRGVEGALLLDVDPGKATNRTVMTLVGNPDSVVEAAFQAIKIAGEFIDMRKQTGAHPRQGATDVCPFCPVRGITMKECVALSKKLGKRVGEELGIPVYLYEYSATRPARKLLPDIRAGEYEALSNKLGKAEWKPDFGPNEFNDRVKRTGVTVIGAREFLIAYNVNLNTAEKKYASDIALQIRETGRFKRTPGPTPFYQDGELVKDEKGKKVREEGMFKNVKAVGWMIEEYGIAQVSINLTNFNVTPPHKVFDACVQLAEERGMRVTGSEIVGLMPLDALIMAGRHYLKKQYRSAGIPEKDLIHIAVKSMGLDDLAPFDPDKKIIEYQFKRKGALVDLSTAAFADEVSRDSMAPGGGSVAALAGALGASLAGMVGNLTTGKREMFNVFDTMSELADEAQEIKNGLLVAVDRDTDAFNEIIKAMRMPKATADEKKARNEAIEEANQFATTIPLETARLCQEALRLAQTAALKGNPASITDAGVAAQMAKAGFEGAVFNVRINLNSVKSETFKKETMAKVKALSSEIETLLNSVTERVEEVLNSPSDEDREGSE
ncbi:MAG: glutamate formimidoyltransferase [Planctomycetota bacterium]